MNDAQTVVSFRCMEEGTAEDYALLERLEADFARRLPERILEQVRRLETTLSGYRVSRLEHSLQCATRARRDGADTDWIVAALVHDIGDDLAPHNHDSLAAEVLKPYVREEVTWVIRHHGIFQLAHYGDRVGADPDARDKYADSPHYAAAVTFCARWDQAAFDPDYPSDALDSFAPLVHEVFTRAPWAAQHLRPGVQVPPVDPDAAGPSPSRGQRRP